MISTTIIITILLTFNYGVAQQDGFYRFYQKREAVRNPFGETESRGRIWENWESDEPVPKRKAALTPWLESSPSQPVQPLVVADPNHGGLLKDIGSIDVGFGIGVGVPGNDPVSVGSRVGVGFGDSGLAGGVPIGENIFPRRGEMRSLNDYDGNKDLILPDKASKYIQAIREGKIRLLKYEPRKSLVGVNGGVGVGR